MMNDRPEHRQAGRENAPRRRPHPSAGLCATCRHAGVIVSDRGSEFVQCGRAKTDPRFARYPALPVVRCGGHDVDEPTGGSDAQA